MRRTAPVLLALVLLCAGVEQGLAGCRFVEQLMGHPAAQQQQRRPAAVARFQPENGPAHRQLLQTNPSTYNPRLVDWASVVAACRAIGRYERRMASFIIRAGYHDAMAINTTCLAANPAAGSVTTQCGGADGSALLAEAEMKRNESLHRTYLRRASRALLPIAKAYKASVADTLAVCGMVMPSAVGAANMLDLAPLKVGRIDNPNPNPASSLLAAEADVTAFKAYWTSRGLTLDEGIALMGVHGLMEGKGCITSPAPSAPPAAADAGVDADAAAAASGPGDSGDGTDIVVAAGSLEPQHTYGKGTIPVCNPLDETDPFTKPARSGSCPNVTMFRMDNQYYIDLLTPGISIVPFKLDVGIINLTQAIYEENYRDIACSFSSDQFRRVGLKEAADERSGDISHWPDGGWLTHNTTGVVWGTNGCSKAKDVLARANCNHLTYWPYTRLDGFLAQASQKEKTALDKQVAASVRSYLSNDKWQASLAGAYAKMLTVVADWSPRAFFPSFRECSKKYVRFGTKDTASCEACNPKRGVAITTAKKAAEALAAGAGKRPEGCPADCVCPTSYGPEEVAVVDHCGMTC